MAFVRVGDHYKGVGLRVGLGLHSNNGGVRSVGRGEINGSLIDANRIEVLYRYHFQSLR